MKLIFQILLNIVVFILIPRKIYLSFLGGKKYRLRKELKHLLHSVKHQIKVNRDLYGPKELQQLHQLKERCENYKKKPVEEWEKSFHKQEADYATCVIKTKNRFMHELTDTLVIAFAVAFGIRALWVQPFKIPTGSMQPTLYGIHLNEGGNEKVPNKFKQIFNYVNYSWRYPEAKALTDCKLFYKGVAKTNSGESLFYPILQQEKAGGPPVFKHSKILLGMQNRSSSTFGQPATVPETYNSDKELTNFYLHYLSSQHGRTFKEGENILNVRHTTGDHIFVDRISYYFTEPKRGDVAVFLTDGFPKEPNGKSSMAGRYYIKRLVGMPGDTLKVVEGKLYVKEKGADKFRVVDKGDHIGFERMYSEKGGYRGYSNEGCFSNNIKEYRFLDEDDVTRELYVSTYKQMPFVAQNGEFTVPEDFYFMMGDNSYNSRDSRYFGPVPRQNIMGKALFCWWPFSRRWGLIDTARPEPYDSNSKLQTSDFDKQ